MQETAVLAATSYQERLFMTFKRRDMRDEKKVESSYYHTTTLVLTLKEEEEELMAKMFLRIYCG